MKKRTYYTDGACVSNGSPKARAAWAWVCRETDDSKAGLVVGKQSNNTAEITAILEALEHARRAGADDVTIYSDSQYAINCIAGSWSRKMNAELFEKVDAVAVKLKKVHFEWVQGHNGDELNERADELSRSQLNLSERKHRPNYSYSISPK